MHLTLVGHRTFRLVGASFALHCSVPNDNIKLQGDWKSTAYDRYLDNALRYKLEAIKQMSQGITHYLPYLSLGVWRVYPFFFLFRYSFLSYSRLRFQNMSSSRKISASLFQLF